MEIGHFGGKHAARPLRVERWQNAQEARCRLSRHVRSISAVNAWVVHVAAAERLSLSPTLGCRYAVPRAEGSPSDEAGHPLRGLSKDAAEEFNRYASLLFASSISRVAQLPARSSECQRVFCSTLIDWRLCTELRSAARLPGRAARGWPRLPRARSHCWVRQFFAHLSATLRWFLVLQPDLGDWARLLRAGLLHLRAETALG